MQEKHLYEYAVIRVLPFVEREEFINVGIIMFSKKEKYITVCYTIDEKKLNSFLILKRFSSLIEIISSSNLGSFPSRTIQKVP